MKEIIMKIGIENLNGFKLKTPRDILYDKCKIQFGYKFEHLVRECPELVEHPKDNWLPLGFCFSLWTQFKLRLPELTTGISYTKSEIFGIEYWIRQNDVLRYIADDCLMWLIDEEGIQLPLDRVQQNDEGISLYRLK